MNERLHGLLDRVRKPELFRGEPGETLLIAPPKNSLGTKKLLVIGLGDSQTFSLQRMQLVGEMVYREASNLGVTKFTTGQVAEQMIGGFLRAAVTDNALKDANAVAGSPVSFLTYLAGAANASTTREGIEKAISVASRK